MAADVEFRRVMSSATNDDVLIPLLRLYLYDPHFRAFEVPTDAWHERKPDGYFHPSTHPLWTERQLYYYALYFRNLIHEPMDPHSTMAITQGNFWHAFMQNCLEDMGVLRICNPGKKTPHERVERYVSDRELGARGWMDGELVPDKLSIDEPEGLEIKSMSTRLLASCPKGTPTDPAKLIWLKIRHPDYYAQAQEYLRMSGLSVQRMLIISIGYPFVMVEIVIPYSWADSSEVAAKYRRARQAAAERRPPPPCCAPRSKESKVCVARNVCSIGRIP